MLFYIFYCFSLSDIPFPPDCKQFETAEKNSSRYQQYDCVFVLNTYFQSFSEEHGGAIYYIGANTKQLFVHFCTFTYCSAQGLLYSSGGAIFESAKNFSLVCTTFYRCNAVNKGQAVLACTGSTLFSKVYLNQSVITQCATFDEFEFPYYSFCLSRANIEAYGLNSSNNKVTEYGASFGLLDANKVDFSFSTIDRNEGRNIMHLSSSDEEVKVIKSCNIIENIPRDPAVVMFYGNWAIVNCIIHHIYGKFYSFDWSKEGNLLFENCKIHGFVLTPSGSVEILNATYDYRKSFIKPEDTCQTLSL